MPSTFGSGALASYKRQADALIDQAAPVQNTWYTLLGAYKNVRLIAVKVQVATTGETLQIQIIADGLTQVGEVAAVADTGYELLHSLDLVNPNTYFFSNAGIWYYRAFFDDFASLTSIKVRKTTANGAGNLYAQALWSRR